MYEGTFHNPQKLHHKRVMKHIGGIQVLLT